MALAFKNDSKTIATYLKKQPVIRFKKARTSLRKTFTKKRNQRRAIYAALSVIVFALFFGWVITAQAQADKQHQLQHTIHVKQVQLKKVDTEKIQTQQQLQQQVQHEQELQKQIDDLNKQLEAKKASQLADQIAAQAAPQPIQPIATPVYQPIARVSVIAGCGDNEYAHFIYMHESGCNTGAMNAGGCYGIGQACPGSKVSYCGLDYGCQNAWFSSYASKYGGWAGAYAFWVAHSWW